MSLNLLPNMNDLVAAGLAAASAAMFSGMGSPGQAGLEQLVAQVAGKVGAGYLNITDGANMPELGIQEHDMLVGVLRAGYSAQQKRSNNRILMDGGKGVLCSALGRQLGVQLSFGGMGGGVNAGTNY